MKTHMNPVSIQPPSYGGPDQATAIRSAPFEVLKAIGGSGMPSTATESDAMSWLCSFMISTLYLPLWFDVMLLMISFD